MAYTDLVSSGITPTAGGATYSFAFDTPIAADRSPHITHFGIQLNAQGAAAFTTIAGLSTIISQLRVKVGSNIVMDWTDNVAAKTAAALSQSGVLVMRTGGQDYSSTYTTAAGINQGAICELLFPLGLPADKTHRVNVTCVLGNEALILTNGMTGAASELNVSLNYGVSLEQTIYGSAQQFTMAANQTRVVTIFGKQGYSLLGVLAASNQDLVDNFLSARVNNGAFRELNIQQWRALNNSFASTDATSLRLGDVPVAGAAGNFGQQTMLSAQAGVFFMNLRRLTPGANIDIAFTYGANGDTPLSLYPVYVANISQRQGPPVRQTIKQPQSTTQTVEVNSQG